MYNSIFIYFRQRIMKLILDQKMGLYTKEAAQTFFVYWCLLLFVSEQVLFFSKGGIMETLRSSQPPLTLMITSVALTSTKASNTCTFLIQQLLIGFLMLFVSRSALSQLGPKSNALLRKKQIVQILQMLSTQQYSVRDKY